MSQADMLNLLAYKIAEYISQRTNEGHKHHEEIDKSTVGTMEEDGSTLQLRFTPETPTKELVSSGNAYRAFIERYS